MDGATTVPEVTENEEIAPSERPLTRVPLVLNRRSYGWIAGDTLGNPAVTPPVQYQGDARKGPLGGCDLLVLSYFWYCGGAVHIQSSSRAKPRDPVARLMDNAAGFLGPSRTGVFARNDIITFPLSR